VTLHHGLSLAGTVVPARVGGAVWDGVHKMKNNFYIQNRTVFIEAWGHGQKHQVLIDLPDLPLVASVHGTWHAELNQGIWYAKTTVASGKRGGRLLRLHNLLINALPGFVIDHINHNGLDNRRMNLRIVTTSQNTLNRNGLSKNNTSGYRGVSLFRGKWKAKIGIGNRKRHLGVFDTKEEAAAAFDMAFKQIANIQ
jgi:hypothetical protein